MSCRTSREKRALIRVVRTPSGDVIVDPSGRANGRGAYVCHDDACIDRAVGRGGLARALEARVPDEIAHDLRAAAGSAGAPTPTSPAPRATDVDIQED